MALAAFSATARGRIAPPASATPAALASAVGRVRGRTAHQDGLGEHYTPHIVVAGRVPGRSPPLALPRGPQVCRHPRPSIAVRVVVAQPNLGRVVQLSALGLPFDVYGFNVNSFF